MSDAVDDWLGAVPDGEHGLAAAVLEVAREALTEAEETVKWNQPCFVVAGTNCLSVAAQSGYVNLGFFEGAALDDPTGLLEGTGEAMRHVKVRSTETLDDPELSALVRAAADRARR